MSFRTRVLLAFVPVALVPLVVFGLGARRVVRERLTEQYQRRVDAFAAVMRRDLDRRGADVAQRLAGLRAAAQADNNLRRALLGSRRDRPYLLDYAADAMRLAGLDMLQLQNDRGRILSSGHFRNEFDRFAPALHFLLSTVPARMALVRARVPDGEFLVLTRAETFRVGNETFGLAGGVVLDSAFAAALVLDRDLRISLITPHVTLASRPGDSAAVGERVVAEEVLPYIDAAAIGGLGSARIVVSHSLAPLEAWRRSLDDWFRSAVLVSVATALLLALWFSFRVTRPLASLATTAGALDLDRLDVEFASDRRDEIGALARVLDAMKARLRVSAGRLREMERRATLGELARQLNHDVKNGLAPLRNVVQHLAEVARGHPRDLRRVFEERRATLESGIAYLEGLAANYARLTPRMNLSPCDVNEVVRETVGNAAAPANVRISLALTPDLPPVLADRIVLRRILENLISNAIDSLESQSGAVSVVTEVLPGENDVPPGVRLIAADTGRGMTRAELDRAFDGFYTTKRGGTGLGLAIVRRLVLDLGGRVKVETAPKEGSRFVLELPGTNAGARRSTEA